MMPSPQEAGQQQQQQQKRRSRSAGRRASNDSARSSGKSYSEIREAYNIPTNDTLPPGVKVRGGSGSGSVRARSDDGMTGAVMSVDLSGRTGGATVNTGMSTMPTGNRSGDNSNESSNDIKNAPGRPRLPRRKSKSSTDLSGTLGTSDSSLGKDPAARNPRGNVNGNGRAGYASDGGGVIGRNVRRPRPGLGPRQDTGRFDHVKASGGRVAGLTPARSPALLQRAASARRVGDRPGGYASDGGSAIGRNARRPRPGGYASDSGAAPARGGARDRPALGEQDSSSNVKRLSFDGAPRPGRIQAIIARKKMGKRGGSAGGSSDGEKDGGQEKFNPGQFQQRPRLSGGRGLKPLPEHASFRGSNRFTEALLSQSKPMQKDLNYMTLEELRDELRQQGIAVEGAFERNDLMNICAQKRKQWRLEAPPGGNTMGMEGTPGPAISGTGLEKVAGAALADIVSYPYRPGGLEKASSSRSVGSMKSGKSVGSAKSNKSQGNLDPRGRAKTPTLASRIKRDSFSVKRRPVRRGTSLDRASAPPIEGERGENGNGGFSFGGYSRKRSLTLEDLEGDNPQQGNGHNGSGHNNVKREISPGRLARRNSGVSNISSVSDPEEALDGMLVVNAPLGAGLSSFSVAQGDPRNNPNQQMGALLTEMKRLEDRMADAVPPGGAGGAGGAPYPQVPDPLGLPGSQGPVEGGGAFGIPAGYTSGGELGGSSRSLGWKNSYQDAPPSPPLALARPLSHGSGHGGMVNSSHSLNRRLSGESCGGLPGAPLAPLGPGGLQRGGSAPSTPGGSWRSGAPPQSDRGSQRDFNSSGRSLNRSGCDMKMETISVGVPGSTGPSVMGTDRELSTDKLSAKEGKCCSCSKKCICIALIFVILLGGAVAGALLVFVFDIDEKVENAGEAQAPATKGAANQANLTASSSNPPARSPVQYVTPPPPDIEGRCSPSNLPGSRLACHAACLPSACCYPDQDAESCIDDTDLRSIDACNRYRPYCDVFYDAWADSESGALRRPLTSIVSMCIANKYEGSGTAVSGGLEESSGATTSNGMTMSTGAFASNEGERPALSFERKRIRAHAEETNEELKAYLRHPTGRSEKDHQPRNLWVPDPDAVCEYHCKAVRCCHAPTHAAGTVLSESGVHTNSTTGEHVVMNCQQEGGINKELCKEYDKFCDIVVANVDNGASHAGTSDNVTSSTNITWARHPAPDPTPSESMDTIPSPSTAQSNNVFLIESPTASPTASSLHTLSPRPSSTSSIFSSPPSVSLSPSMLKIPPASTLEITAACSGNENEALISGEDSSARAACFSACEYGLCCYSELLGYSSWLAPCFEGNEERCLQYLPCRVLGKGEEDENTANIVTDGPPPPEKDISLLCSKDSILDLVVLEECLSSCEAGSCCNAQEAEFSCYAETVCALYEPCKILMPPTLPPLPPENLDTACAYESLATSGDECHELCQQGLCCSNGSCLDDGGSVSEAFLDQLDEVCEMYRPCHNLFLISSPPIEFEEACDRSAPISFGCANICSPVSCCFTESEGSTPTTSSLRSNSIVMVTVCPDAYDPSVASSYEAGSEVELEGVVYRCNAYPWVFYCTHPKFAPQGENEMWVDTWTVVGPCIDATPTPNPTEHPTPSPMARSNDSTSAAIESPSSCYEYFKDTCNEYATYCAPGSLTLETVTNTVVDVTPLPSNTL